MTQRAECYIFISGADCLIYGAAALQQLKAKFGDEWCTGAFDSSGGMFIQCYPLVDPLTYLEFDIQTWNVVIHCAWVALQNAYAYGSWILRPDSVQTESFVKLEGDEILEDGQYRPAGRLLDFLHSQAIAEYF